MADDEGNESSDAYCSSDEKDLSYVNFHTEVDANVVIKTVAQWVSIACIKKRKKKELGDDESLNVKKVTTRSRSNTDEGTSKSPKTPMKAITSGEGCLESPKLTKAKVKGLQFQLVSCDKLIRGEIWVDGGWVFDEIADRDLVSWNSMIFGCVKMGFAKGTFELFKEMKRDGFKPDDMTVVSVLGACGDLGDLGLGKVVEEYVVENEMEVNSYVG
ncbi:pentatricopeptide repeat-containing protein [Tanacetum coccineum]